MNREITFERLVYTFGVPAVLLLGLILLVKSSVFDQSPSVLSIGVTADLLFTIPLVYFLLIRKTKIPKTTVIPVLLLGIVVGSLILPVEHQYYLSFFKKWLLPLIEVSVFAFVVIKVRKVIKNLSAQRETTTDFFTALKEVCFKLVPRKIAMLLATEIAVIYYGFYNWRRRRLQQNEFTSHKSSGTIALLSVCIFLILFETFIIHLLLARWSSVAAWILSGLSIYTAVQVFGIIRSIPKRPYILERNKLQLRYGILNETTIDLDNIETVEFSDKAISQEETFATLSPLRALESHNILITLKEEGRITGLYGMKKKYKKLAFYVDNKEQFKEIVESGLALNSARK